MTLAAITETPFKLAICIAALVMLVLSQLSMAHAMSAMNNGSSIECVEHENAGHSSHRDGAAKSATPINAEQPTSHGHTDGHDMSDDHCAVSCSIAYIGDGPDFAPAFHANTRYVELSSFPASGTLQGLNRPPRV